MRRREATILDMFGWRGVMFIVLVLILGLLRLL